MINLTLGLLSFFKKKKYDWILKGKKSLALQLV